MTDELVARARTAIDGIRYMSLATADAAGVPWVSPVFFTPDGYRRYLWVSSPDALHSAFSVMTSTSPARVTTSRSLPSSG